MRFGWSQGKRQARRQGFSLVELSVVVAIMSVVAVLGLEGAANFVNRTSSSVSKERLVMLDDAVARFFKIYGRLPCPAARGLAPSDTSYGLENCSIPLLTSTTLGGGLMSGAIPFRTLNLPLSLSLDGFGSKFNYVVTKNLTVAGTASDQFGYYDGTSVATLADSGIGGIEIRTGILEQPCTASTCQVVANPTPVAYPADGDPARPFPDGAVYVIFSSGSDKRGAVSAAGVSLGGCVPNPTDSYRSRVDTQNCVQGDNVVQGHITAHLGGDTIAYNVFYDSRYNTGFVLTNYFDDLVIWRKRGQL